MFKFHAVAASVIALGLVAVPVASLAQTGAPPATEITPSGPLPEVPRNQTLNLAWGVSASSSIGTTNPWVLPG